MSPRSRYLFFAPRATQNQPRMWAFRCSDFRCPFSGRERDLPIVAVDEPIYRRLPCFIIATVDKFAALPWLGRVGAFFGKVERFDQDGFYGPCDPGVGNALPGGRLPSPDLIVQDELHLISGPLGTIAGLYETVIDELSATGELRPKIISSTATVRKADAQIRALFGRTDVEIFPPPGPDRKNSFFAKTVPATETPARLEHRRSWNWFVGHYQTRVSGAVVPVAAIPEGCCFGPLPHAGWLLQCAPRIGRRASSDRGRSQESRFRIWRPQKSGRGAGPVR